MPGRIGVGIAFGAATKLEVASADPPQVLDYSGRPLNLAARLMDLARPQGVVFDESYPTPIIDQDVMDRFTSRQAYIRGFSETEPRDVYYVNAWTELSEEALRPIGVYEWRAELAGSRPMSSWMAITTTGFTFFPTETPAWPDEVKVIFEYRLEGGRRRSHHARLSDCTPEFGRLAYLLDQEEIERMIEEFNVHDVPDDVEIQARLIYQVRAGAVDEPDDRDASQPISGE